MMISDINGQTPWAERSMRKFMISKVDNALFKVELFEFSKKLRCELENKNIFHVMVWA
jgi:hypothetical protein